MTTFALIYLVSAVMITAAASALAVAAYRLTYTAGHFSAGEARFFDQPEAEASAVAILFAFAAGILYALAGALLHASMLTA